MTTKSRIISIATVAATMLAVGLPAFALVGANATGAGAADRQQLVAQRIQNGQDRGGQEITSRITALNSLLTRIQGMKNLSDSQKSAFGTTIQTELSDMSGLKAKIQSDTSTTTLRADLKTIAPDYRIYMLIVPQTSILSAVDRVNTLVGTLGTIQTKIQTRVSADASLSGNATITADMSDLTARLADATTQANAAQAEVVGLAPDQGNQTVMQSNTAALKDARAKIKAATLDLQAARKDAGDMVKLIMQSTKSLMSASSTPR